MYGGFNCCVIVLAESFKSSSFFLCRKEELKPISDSELPGRLKPSAEVCSQDTPSRAPRGVTTRDVMQRRISDHQADLAIRATPPAIPSSTST